MSIKTFRDAKAELGRHDITQIRLADALGYTPSEMSNIFKGCSDGLTDLTPAGAARVEDAIDSILNGVPVQGAVA